MSTMKSGIFRTAILSLFAGAVLSACGDSKKGIVTIKRIELGVGQPQDPKDPEDGAIRQVVEKVLSAAKSGDVEAVKPLVAPHLAAKLKPQAQPMDYQIRDVFVGRGYAEVSVLMTRKDRTDMPPTMLMTYKLVRHDKGWVVDSFTRKGHWEYPQ
jgi:hypothetical protein